MKIGFIEKRSVISLENGWPYLLGTRLADCSQSPLYCDAKRNPER